MSTGSAARGCRACHRTLALLVAAGMGFAQLPRLSASDVGQVVASATDIDSYATSLEATLFTHTGDDRGFGPEHDLARDAAVAFLETLPGLTVTLEPFDYLGTTYHNIVAEQTGSELPDEVVVVGAHFDSVDNPGADDNGSGSALVLEMARVLAGCRPVRTVRYVLFDREEQGLVGSEAYVDAHAGDGIVLAVIADMIAHDSGAYGVELRTDAASAAVASSFSDAVASYGATLGATVISGTFPYSDHWPFEAAGIPAFLIIEDCYACNPYYHTPQDSVDTVGYIDYPMVADLLSAVAGYLVDEAGFGIYGDFDGDGDVDLADASAFADCFTGAGGGIGGSGCLAGDFDGDGDIDCEDRASFELAWTASDPIPDFPPCCGAVPCDSFARGDCNGDGGQDISDPVHLLGVLFPSGGGGTISCGDACDVNDDGTLDIADAVAALDGLFTGGASPPPPYPGCGVDPTDDVLGCAVPAPCP